jgi:hypothetical protein
MDTKPFMAEPTVEIVFPSTTEADRWQRQGLQPSGSSSSGFIHVVELIHEGLDLAYNCPDRGHQKFTKEMASSSS